MNELETVSKADSSGHSGGWTSGMSAGFPVPHRTRTANGSSDWHRGMVVSVGQDPLSCKILYVDYGTMAEVKRTMLRTLKDEFLVLPAQAIRATMGHLKPFSPSGWTAQSKSRFMELVSGDRTLMCKVLERQGVAYSINLCDTTPIVCT
uniref:Putative a kinase anchor protein n=1 Tax=Ixodes ricinus TaxID=34613 RepID=A0A0K8RAV5_IXORI